MWKVHTEPRQSSTHLRPQKTCSLSGILEHTCNIWKYLKDELFDVTTHLTEGEKNDKLSQGIQKGNCTHCRPEAVLRRAPLQCWLSAGTGNLNFRKGVWLTMLFTQAMWLIWVCAYLLGVWYFLYTRQAVPAKLVTIKPLSPQVAPHFPDRHFIHIAVFTTAGIGPFQLLLLLCSSSLWWVW